PPRFTLFPYTTLFRSFHTRSKPLKRFRLRRRTITPRKRGVNESRRSGSHSSMKYAGHGLRSRKYFSSPLIKLVTTLFVPLTAGRSEEHTSELQSLAYL